MTDYCTLLLLDLMLDCWWWWLIVVEKTEEISLSLDRNKATQHRTW